MALLLSQDKPCGKSELCLPQVIANFVFLMCYELSIIKLMIVLFCIFP